MPELPEVEITLRGIKPFLINHSVTQLILRRANLRWPMPDNLPQHLRGQRLKNIQRRGKYLLFFFTQGTLILHLGMSGKLTILKTPKKPEKHDHVDVCFDNNCVLRFTDPRRFGALLWTSDDPTEHPLLKDMGVEPLTPVFDAVYLWERARGRKVAIKNFIMDGKIVTGVGNIYATEALFQAGILPSLPAYKLSKKRCERLVREIKAVLESAIKQGGTTLKDFARPDGNPGYFNLILHVYGKGGKPCPQCGHKLSARLIGQRTTTFCRQCQC